MDIDMSKFRTHRYMGDTANGNFEMIAIYNKFKYNPYTVDRYIMSGVYPNDILLMEYRRFVALFGKEAECDILHNLNGIGVYKGMPVYAFEKGYDFKLSIQKYFIDSWNDEEVTIIRPSEHSVFTKYSMTIPIDVVNDKNIFITRLDAKKRMMDFYREG